MDNLRKFTGMREFNITPYSTILLYSSAKLKDDLFSNLEYYSEINDVGIEFIKSYGYTTKKQQENVFFLFQSFIRQSKIFYEAAEVSDFRASPLLYYYSFINLAKAFLCLIKPKDINKKIHHGLFHNFQKTKFENQNVIVGGGIFPILYKAIIGKPIKEGTSLNISNLFAYQSDITYEYYLANYGDIKFIPGKSQLCVNQNESETWPVISLHNPHQINKYKKYFKSFNNYFEKIDFSKNLAKDVFNIDGTEFRDYSFYQSKKIYKYVNNILPANKIMNDCWGNIRFYCMPISKKSDFDFFIFLPLKNNLQIPFNDTLAAYVIMFYLGSLIRYHPYYLENLFNSKHAWIIERFTKNCGTLYLRNICNLILKKNLIYANN